MADTMTTLANLFKNKYEPEFTKAFNEEFLGFQLATKEKRSFSGGSEIFGVQIQRSAGTGMRAETQALPTPGGPVPLQASVALKRMFHVFSVSHDAVERSVGDESAFKEVLGWEIENGFMRMKKVANVYFYGDGTGILATVVTGGTFNAAVGSTLQITVDTTRYLEPGDLVALWTSAAGATLVSNGGQVDTGTTATAANSENVQISSVDSSTLVTLIRVGTAAGGACTVATNNVIRLYGDATTDTSTVTSNVFSGLGLFADDGTVATSFEGISRSTYPRWKGQVIAVGSSSTASAPLTRDYMYRLNDKIRRNSHFMADTLIWDLSMRREYLNLLQPDVRFAPVKDTDGGYDSDGESLAMTLGNKRWTLYEDVDVPYGTVYAFPKSVLYWMELSGMQLDSSTGSVLKQAMPYGSVSGAGDIFYGYARCKGNFATDAASAFGKLQYVSYSAE